VNQSREDVKPDRREKDAIEAHGEGEKWRGGGPDHRQKPVDSPAPGDPLRRAVGDPLKPEGKWMPHREGEGREKEDRRRHPDDERRTASVVP
jgi:hypothetical protein